MLRALVQLARRIFFPLALILTASLSAQTPAERATPVPPPVPAIPKPAYPDSTSGLEHLAKDILKAQAQNDTVRADALLQSLALPDAYDWYDRSFGRGAADVVGEYYQKAAASVAPSLARNFIDIQERGFSQIQALRYEQSCDDNAAEEAYGLLLRRSEPFPIYELRFFKAGGFVRIFPIAYVDGAFRFFLSPDFHPPAESPKDTPPEAHPSNSSQSSVVRRVVVTNGHVQAAKLIKKVQPVYPERARSERVSGTVKIHVVIGKDGQPSRILGVRGVCSLAESAVAAVRQWRYQPTLLNGKPVEVDTEIDVVYSLDQ
jgi:TonB family protein